MSEWEGKPAAARDKNHVVPVHGRRKNVNQVITPYVSLSLKIPEFQTHLDGIRSNQGQYSQSILRLFGEGVERIERVTPVYRNDGTPAYLEVRASIKLDKKKIRAKTYRVIYRADVDGSDEYKHDGQGILRVGIEALSAQGLYIPTNSQALLEAVRIFKADTLNNLQPAFLWCEGEKTREALEHRVSAPEALEAFAQKGLIPVTAATLGGMAGVAHTNYLLRPDPSSTLPTSTVVGRNDQLLDLKAAKHYIILDNDSNGYDEGTRLASRLTAEYLVPHEQVHVVDAPHNAPVGWDDADALPHLCAESDRITQILSAPHYNEMWVYKVKGQARWIDENHMRNRRRALQLAGIEDGYFDCAIGRPVFVTKGLDWVNPEEPNETELLNVAETALEKMGHQPLVQNLKETAWRVTLNSVTANKKRDSIHEEFMRKLEIGRAQTNEANKPERLFIETFGMPDTPFIRLAGWHLMRDMVALQVRNAFNGEPVIPQLLFVMHGQEGCGKSSFVKVVAGGSPGATNDAPRYADDIQLADVQPSKDHGDTQLYQKAAGKIAIELADKSLGHEGVRNQQRADVLKQFANKGGIRFRSYYAKGLQPYNLRCVRIFTTNSSDILTHDMGSRRWVIIDLTQSKWTFETGKHNPGLNWLHENLNAMLAHMYDSDAWRNDLHSTDEFAAMLGESQEDYISQDAWEQLLAEELRRMEDDYKVIGIKPFQLSAYVVDRFGARAPKVAEINKLLRQRGWENPLRRPKKGEPDEASTRVWVFGTKSTRGLKAYAQWLARDGSSAGRWVIQDNPGTSEAVDMMEAASKEMPF